jgi:DNA-binding beta-propeller fold protein YncE
MRSRRGLIALGTGFLASLLLLAGLASSASAVDRVYWANGRALDANRIGYTNADGTGDGGNLITTGGTTGQPRGVAIDAAAGKVYWTNRDAGEISFANLDGSGGTGDLNTGSATVLIPNGAAVYPTAGEIYWANEDGQISVANLDNTDVGRNLNITNPAVDIPVAPMFDPGSGRIYWANTVTNAIHYANPNGSDEGTLDTTGVTANNPHGLALDPETNRIYWANPGTDEAPVSVISYADPDDPNDRGELTVDDATTVNRPVGVAIDPEKRKIYWGNWGNDTIAVANLDGSDAQTLSTDGAAAPNGARSPSILEAPTGTGAPTITGGSSAGSVLTCSQGEWAPDQLASWLYRAPHDFTYSWSRNGTAIPGANGATYTASEGGNYSCTVTASNPAGSSQPQTSAARTVSASSGNNPPPPAGNSSKPSTPPASGGSSKPSTTKLAFGSKTLTTMSVSGRRISGNGPIKVVISNKNGFQVSGTLSARAKRVKVSRGFAVGANAKKTVRVKLSKALKRMLKRQGKLSLRLTVKVNDPAGNTRTVRKNVSLRLKTG